MGRLTRPSNGSTRGRLTLCTNPLFLGLHTWAMEALHPPLVLGLHACNKMDAWPMDAWAMDALHPPLVFRDPRV